jgi:hypothetical protein
MVLAADAADLKVVQRRNRLCGGSKTAVPFLSVLVHLKKGWASRWAR